MQTAFYEHPNRLSIRQRSKLLIFRITGTFQLHCSQEHCRSKTCSNLLFGQERQQRLYHRALLTSFGLLIDPDPMKLLLLISGSNALRKANRRRSLLSFNWIKYLISKRDRFGNRTQARIIEFYCRIYSKTLLWTALLSRPVVGANIIRS